MAKQVRGTIKPDEQGRWVVIIKVGRKVVDKQVFYTPGGARMWRDDRVAYLRATLKDS